MSATTFKIKILDLHWIHNEGDDPDDLCAHGTVFVQIGDEVICNADSLDVTVSATALYLLRTLNGNYSAEMYASQLLPCCGHFIISNDEGNHVEICGCPEGIDWTITHIDDNTVKHTSHNGTEVFISKDAYIKQVLHFADTVENFYKAGLPKNIPDDDFTKKGYTAFWTEWRILRDKWNDFNF